MSNPEAINYSRAGVGKGKDMTAVKDDNNLKVVVTSEEDREITPPSSTAVSAPPKSAMEGSTLISRIDEEIPMSSGETISSSPERKNISSQVEDMFESNSLPSSTEVEVSSSSDQMEQSAEEVKHRTVSQKELSPSPMAAVLEDESTTPQGSSSVGSFI